MLGCGAPLLGGTASEALANGVWALVRAANERELVQSPDLLEGLHVWHMRLKLPIVSRHQEDGVFLGQREMNVWGLRLERGEVRLFKRDCSQVRALPHHPMMWPPDFAWQSPQSLHYLVQRMLVDHMLGRTLDAMIKGLLRSA